MVGSMGGLLIVLLILVVDFVRFVDEVVVVNGVDWLYVDVMDGYFVLNLIIGLLVVESLLVVIDILMDCYLMIDNLDWWVLLYVEVGVYNVIFYVEVIDNLVGVVCDIWVVGVKVGISVKLGILLELYLDILFYFDILFVMLVEFGFGG